MAAVSLFWYTNMAAVTSGENALYIVGFTGEENLGPVHMVGVIPARRGENCIY